MSEYTQIDGFYYQCREYEVRHHLTCIADKDNVIMKAGQFSALTTLPGLCETVAMILKRLKAAGCFRMTVTDGDYAAFLKKKEAGA